MQTRRFVLAALLAAALPAWAEHKPVDPTRYVTTHVTVTGEVERPQSLSVDDLRALPAAQLGELPLVCQSGANMGKLERLKGVRLRELLNRAVIRAPGHNDVKGMAIVAIASDGYRAVFSWNELFNTAVGDGVLVFFERDGKALSDAEGKIALVSAADLRTGPRHVKWLQGIEVRKVAQ